MAKKQTKICNEQFVLSVTKDKLMATITPVDDAVSYQDVDFNEVLKEIQEKGICFGFVNKLEPDNGRVAVVAGGTPPAHGENAKLKPIIKPSTKTILMISKSVAPMARIMPISRVRSSTFILIVPAKPIAPTTAVSTAMINRKVIKISIL